MNGKVNLGHQATGVPGFDTLLGGGLSEFSFNVIAGAPCSRKTKLAHQIMFGLATPKKKALFFTVPGEPPLKMLRFSQADTSFLADAIVAMRYVETKGSLTKVISVIKLRGSAHSLDICQYKITDRGIEINRQPMPYEGILSGHPSAIQSAK